MDPLQLSVGDTLLRAENGVCDLFQIRLEGSLRIPIVRLAALAQPLGQAEGPLVRAFFTQVADQVGRSVQP